MNPAGELPTTWRISKELDMTDDDVQREVEANERRARDTEEVGVDENVLNEEDGDGNIVSNFIDSVFHPDEDTPGDEDHEYDDNTTAPQQ
jgi:hypothetical protein